MIKKKLLKLILTLQYTHTLSVIGTSKTPCKAILHVLLSIIMSRKDYV